MADDIIRFEITDNGLVKLDTDGISPVNHLSAEQLVKGIARVAGGTTTKTVKRKHSHGTHGAHTHEGEHEKH